MNRAALPRLVALVALCVAVPALTVGSPAAHAATPDPRPSVHRSAKGVVSYDDPRYAGRRTIAVKGTVQTTIGESFDDRRVEQSQSIRTASGDLIPVSTRAGTTLPTGGRFVGEVVDADSTTQPVAAATVTPAAVAAAPVATIHHAYVAVVDKSTPLMDSDTANALVGQATAYWVEQSASANGTNAITEFPIEQTVTYTSSAAGTCDTTTSVDALWADAASKFDSVNFGATSGNHLIVVLPDCAGGGRATVGSSLASGGKVAMGVANGGAYQLGAHELGHNFGLGHANLEHCDSAGNGCAVVEYADRYSVMADVIGGPSSPAPPTLGTVARGFLGLTGPSEVGNLALAAGATAATTTSVTLAPRESGSQVRGIEIADPVTGDPIVVDYRSGAGKDAAASYKNFSQDIDTASESLTAMFSPGVVVSRPAANGVEVLMTQRTGTTLRTSFTKGQTYTDATHNVLVHVTTVSSPNTAEVAVTLRPLPSMKGTVKVGGVVTVVPGPWDTIPAYQWLMNGAPVAGATASTYKPAVSGRTLSVRVSGQSDGVMVTRTSKAALVAKGTFTTATPTITGTAKVGRTLNAHHGTWTPTPTWSYQWRANGHNISGATRSTYVISKSRVGQRITVTVSGRRPGYVTKSRGSSSTAVVKR